MHNILNPFRLRRRRNPLPQHDSDIIYTNTGEAVEVDKAIIPLIWAMWTLDIKTYYCCEGKYSEATHNGASRDAGYITMRQDDTSMWFVGVLLSEYPHFVEMNGSFWEISFDRWKGVNRICIRFPHDQIPALTTFVQYLGNYTSQSLTVRNINGS